MKNLLFISFILSLFVFGSCRDDDFSVDAQVSLEFSADTLRFDTVFTERGSATYILKVYNPSDENIRIRSIKLLDDTGFFRMNVDGINSNDVEDVPIFAKDSIYIFCEVTIDPDDPLSVSPFIIQDRIEFNTGGLEQIVYIEAWGQNANYFPSRANQKNAVRLSCDFGEVIWDDEKPYVLYGIVFIDSCTLRVLEGTRIYVHGGVVSNELGVYNDGILFALPDGRIRLEGSLEAPIIIEDDRLEPSFDDVAGQFSGIRFGPLSRGNFVEHTVIRNCIVGIQMDSLAEAELVNVEISNTSGSGVVAVHADLDMTNCLIHDNGGSSVSVIHGGQARIKYCTFANYGNQSPSINMNNFRCYDQLCQVSDVNPLDIAVFNSLLVGDDRNEIGLVDGTPEDLSDFSYSFNHILYRAEDIIEDNPGFLDRCNNCTEVEIFDPLFVNRQEEDFHLDSLSQAKELALPLFFVPEDKDGVERDSETPDLGCFECVF